MAYRCGALGDRLLSPAAPVWGTAFARLAAAPLTSSADLCSFTASRNAEMQSVSER